MGNGEKQIARLTVDEYAQEIADDLEVLISDHPSGIYISHLQEYYGESISRTNKACQILVQRQVVTLHQAASKAHYIVPTGVELAVPLPELTALQRKLALYLVDICIKHATTRVRTNYSQLSREMHCSYGGLRACLRRLTDLQYLFIESPSLRGKQDEMILSLGQKLVDLKNDR